MFETLLKDIGQRFGLGDRAQGLLGMLLSYMFDERRGGFAGFLDNLRQQGLGGLVSAWFGGGGGPVQSLNSAQVESVFGSDTLRAMASKLGLGQSSVVSAIGAMLPGVVGQLKSVGIGPDTVALPAQFKSLLGGFEGFGDLKGLGAAAAGAGAAAVSRAAGAGSAAVGRVSNEAKGGAGVLPWIVLAALGLLGWWWWSHRGAEAPVASAPAPVATTPAVTAPPVAPPVVNIDPTLSLRNEAGKLLFSGVVNNDAAKNGVLDAIKAAFGDNSSGEIKVDAAARDAKWLGALAGFLPNFKVPGATLDFNGLGINLGGAIADADKGKLLNDALAAFGNGGFNLGGLLTPAPEAAPAPPPAAPASANEAFAALKSGTSSTQDIVKALNLMIVHFDTGSARISADSLDILKQAAEAIKAAPAGTHIEVGGHTDNVGNPASNQTLSQQRAQAVAAKLGELGVAAGVLSAKGFGDANPVADNATPEGRARNRRIEFTLR